MDSDSVVLTSVGSSFCGARTERSFDCDEQPQYPALWASRVLNWICATTGSQCGEQRGEVVWKIPDGLVAFWISCGGLTAGRELPVLEVAGVP